MYNLYIDNELIATGLSPGELCQWILELNDELDYISSDQFKADLGYTEGNFEDFLYDNEPDVDEPVEIRFGDEMLIITEDDI